MKKLCIILLFAFCVVACTTRPGSVTAFLSNTHLLEKGKNFQREYHNPKKSLEGYETIAILPVDTSFLKDMSWWEKANIKNYDDSGIYPGAKADKNRTPAKSLSKYYSYYLRDSFKKDGSSLRYITYDGADEKTLVLRIALTELVPVKKFLLGFSLIGDGSLKGGTVAMEAKIENKSGDLLVMLTDREVNNMFKAERDNKQVNYIAHAKPVVKEWIIGFQSLLKKK